ncbi:aconitate hydratase AcnA [Aestuariibacter sp. A3R04]|nr:aconitate hydratase AcnA [Aestuariibacter sp. A3R04]
MQWHKHYLTMLKTNYGEKAYWSLQKLAEDFEFTLSEQPFIVKLFLENVMRHYEKNTETTSSTEIKTIIKGLSSNGQLDDYEFPFYPSRVLMQDYTGVPAIADLAAMRDAVRAAGGDAEKVNPMCPVDLVIDHSIIVDEAGNDDALKHNRQSEMERNQERYQFLKWAQSSFHNLTVIPPGRGICHQVNLEYFAQVVRQTEDVLYPDTLVGTDSHTTMINGLGVFGWGVGGIEAEAVMLGQPLYLNAPQILGVRLEGELTPGVTATDLVLSITEILRNYGVVGKFVEFYGAGVLNLSVADRATIANMAPEYGATCALFPVDEKVIDYLTLTNRSEDLIEQVRDYTVAQGLFYRVDEPCYSPVYQETLSIDLNNIVPSVSGPKRPQDRLPIAAIKQKTLDEIAFAGHQAPLELEEPSSIMDGDLVIAAITSCTNTSNPQVMLLAGLLAKAAVEKGLTVQPHVKTSLAPGSQVVAHYLDNSGLQSYLNQLGFYRVGFGCTTCIGNSGPLKNGLEALIEQGNLQVSAVLSGNRNFEGRIHPFVRLNWLASPPLVVAFALVGHTRINLDTEPLGFDQSGQPVFLRDIWPTQQLVDGVLTQITKQLYASSYENILNGDDNWQQINIEKSVCFPWYEESTYIRKPPFFELIKKPSSIKDAKILGVFGDSITTDHISPAGQISQTSPAGEYLMKQGITPEQFNSYGSRRGNHEVMMRGTFANRRLKNQIVQPMEGGYTRFFSNDESGATEAVPIYSASQHYQAKRIPLVIFAGKEYGTGSSRDWAAKGCLLLNVKAVIAESFERIHRSNLVGMGIMPLQLPSNLNLTDLHLEGSESITIEWLVNGTKHLLIPKQTLMLVVNVTDPTLHQTSVKKVQSIPVKLRIDNARELDYFLSGGVLHYVINQFF